MQAELHPCLRDPNCHEQRGIHTEATVVDNQGSGGQTDTQFPVDRNQTEVSVMGGVSETQSTSSAAATLLQMDNVAFSVTVFNSREAFTDEGGTGEG